jgi:hypothetical protein
VLAGILICLGLLVLQGLGCGEIVFSPPGKSRVLYVITRKAVPMLSSHWQNMVIDQF